MPDIFVQSFSHLKDRPKADRALQMLQQISSLIKPIMRKHNWVLPVLAEFFPDSPNLLGLNMNMGEKIYLRLRPAHSPDTFYEDEDIVQTMLHEASLTHNVHGPHDDHFYKFLSGLQDEYEALQRSGYAGEGFFSKGQRLGTNVSHNYPPHLARAKALEAAEKRRKMAKGLGAVRLGGRATNTMGMNPRQLAAQAAERRARDEKACGSGALAQHEARKAAKESIVIDLTVHDEPDTGAIIIDQPPPVAEPSKPVVPQPKTVATLSAKNLVAGPNAFNVEEVKSPHDGATGMDHPSPESPGWPCPICTLVNKPTVLQCNACLTERLQDSNAGWICLNCGEMEMPHEFWSCRFCGTVKIRS